MSWLPKLCLPPWWRVGTKVDEGILLCSTVTWIKTISTNCEMATAPYEGQEILPISEFLMLYLCGKKKQNPEHDLSYLSKLLFSQLLVSPIQVWKQSTLAASLWLNSLIPLLTCWSQVGILQGSKYLTAFFGKKEKKPHLLSLSWNLNSSWRNLKPGPQHRARGPPVHPTCWAHLTQISFSADAVAHL